MAEARDGDFYTALLRSISDLDLLRAVRQFYDEVNLKDVIDLKQFQRGALLAQNPKNLIKPSSEDTNANGTRRDTRQGTQNSRFETESTTSQRRPSRNTQQSTDHGSEDGSIPPEPSLTTDEKTLTQVEDTALNLEKAGAFRSLSKYMLVLLACCAIGAVVQGWSQVSIVGANLEWPIDFGIATRLEDGGLQFDKPHGLIYFSLVNAIPYFAASFLGTWVSDPLTHKYGRRFALLFAGVCSFAAPIGGAYCKTWSQLFGCRFVQGVGMGAKSSVVPVLESEVCHPRMRGKLLVSWQTFVAVGIFFGAATNLIFEAHWRLQIGISSVPALLLICLCYVIRESPRWLVKKGRYAEAFVALKDLRQTPLQAARDLYLIHAQLKIETRLFSGDSLMNDTYVEELKSPGHLTGNEKGTGYFRRILQLITVPRNRRAVVGSYVVMAAQQFSGFNIFAFLVTTIFGNSGIADRGTLWLAFGMAATNALSSSVAYFTIDRLGRRTLILTSLCLMFPLLIITGHFLDIRTDGSPSLGRMIALIVACTIAYSFGTGVIPFMYSSEVFPLVHREAGMSLAVSLNLGLAGVLALVVPLSLKIPLHGLRVLGIFAGLDAVAIIAVWLFMRSPDEVTTLEEMTHLFVLPTKDYIKYQIRVAPRATLSRVTFGLLSAKRSEGFLRWYHIQQEAKTREAADSRGIGLGDRA